MKKIMSLMLGLSLLTGIVAFAAPQSTDTSKSTTKKKKSKSKKSTSKMTSSSSNSGK